MKKYYLAIATLVVSTVAMSQQRERILPALPEAGDYSVAIDATPFLNYFGQLLSNAGATAPTWNFLNANQTIVGKYMVDENTAYRGILRIGFGSEKQVAKIDQANGTAPTFPGTASMVEDKYKASSNFVGLGVGLEKRRGKGRLFGIYGADFMIWTAGEKQKYEYGNALSTAAGSPVGVGNSTDFGSNINIDPTYGIQTRTLENKIGRTTGFGLRAFVGAEFFVASKISLGAEFGWGLGLQFTGMGKSSVEGIGGTPAAVGTIERETGKSSKFVLDTDRNAFGTANGALKINFYF